MKQMKHHIAKNHPRSVIEEKADNHFVACSKSNMEDDIDDSIDGESPLITNVSYSMMNMRRHRHTIRSLVKFFIRKN